MSSWKVGRATITPIVEVESVTSPRFLFSGLDKRGTIELAHRAPWLEGTFVDDGGYLLQRIQCLVIDLDGARVAVDTCVGNDKQRTNPGWHELHLPFLDDLETAGFARESIDAVVCTHLHVDHVGWNTMRQEGRWVPTFPTARYLFAEPEFAYWQVTADPNGDVFGDSVAPVHEAGLAELVAVDHAVDGAGIRFDSTPGHTPGHVSVVVESAGERAVITGDMIHTPIQIAEVALSSGFDFDPSMAAQTRASFLERYADGSLVIGTHWGGPGAGRVVRHDDGWAIDPVPVTAE